MNAPDGIDIELTAHDGLALHLTHFPVDAPRGVVVLLHGLCEHGRRHLPAVRAINAAGWSVVAPDLRGHGRSGGQRGGLQRDDDMLHDLAAVLDHTATLYPGLTRVVFGHSTGGAVASRFVAELAAGVRPRERAVWSRTVDGLILTSPALQASIGMIQKALLTTMGRLMQDVALPVVSKPEWITSDPEVIREAEQDPLGHRQITPRLALFIDGQGRVTLSRAAQWSVPTLLMYTPRDRLISPQACAEFGQRAHSGMVTARPFPVLAHNMLRDTERRLVLDAAAQWLSTHFPKAA